MKREMKDSGIPWIGEIPKDWKINVIGNLYKHRSEKVSDKDFPPLSVTKNGIVPQLETAAKTNDNDNRKLVRIGDFAINSRSDRRGSCGISWYDGSISLINTVITPRTTMVPQFYDWLFHTESFADEFYRWGHGIVDDLWTTGWQEMRKISIIMPSIEEQKSIAEFLDKKCGEIDELISLQERMIEELKAYKQSVITEAVTGKYYFSSQHAKGMSLQKHTMKDSGIEWIGQIPANWEIVRLSAIGTTVNGISKEGSSFGEGFPFVSYKDVYNNYSLPKKVTGLVNSTENEQQTFSVKSGDVFFTRTSETIEEIGFSSVCLETISNAVFAGFLIRFRPKPNKLKPQFSKFYFRAICHRNYFVKEMNLVTRASLSQNLLKSMPVLLPPLSEQQEIADYLDKKCSEIDSLIDIKQKKIKELKDYKKSIIYEYVTGKKQCRDMPLACDKIELNL